MSFRKLLKQLVPRVGFEPTPDYSQRILSPFPGRLTHSTSRYQVVFTGRAAVKVMLRPVDLATECRHPSVISVPKRALLFGVKIPQKCFDIKLLRGVENSLARLLVDCRASHV